MCDKTKNVTYLELVSEINSVYEALASLSNDDLRTHVKEIEASLKSTDDANIILDKYLVEVYAIVKETARRFTKGSIEVIANEYDKWLADNYDFVSINGNKAIYLNHWQVGGAHFQWDMIHYNEQILGGIHLHYGHAIEMATGEGKTLVATLPVFLNALAHKGVHLMTVNDYLSKRDYEITRPIYMFHGLTAECLENFKRGILHIKQLTLQILYLGKTLLLCLTIFGIILLLTRSTVYKKIIILPLSMNWIPS